MAENQVIVNDDGSIVVNEVADTSVVTQVEQTTVVEQADDVEVVSIEQATTVVESDDGTSVTITDVGVQGAAAEDTLPLARRVDFVGETIIYIGESIAGTLDSAAGWRVKRIDIITGLDSQDDFETRWASGDINFDKVWDDRAGFTYT